MNRAEVATDNHLKTIIALVENSRLVNVAVPVLYNICCDYGMLHLVQQPQQADLLEPAQVRVVEYGLIPTLITALSAEALDASSPAFTYLCRLFELGLPHRMPSP